ncbi:hypothetical protein V6N13_148916 [Hibiscus sabdariffa]
MIKNGDVVDSYIASKLDNKGRRFGFLRYSNRNDAVRALERLNGCNLYGARIAVSFAKFNSRSSFWRKKKNKSGYHEDFESKGKQGLGDSNKDSKLQVKRVVGHVEDESLWKLSKCLIGIMATDCNSENVMDRLHKWGLGELEVKSLGSRRFLIVIKDEDLLKTLEENHWSLLKEVFVDVEYWSDSFKIPERTTCIEVAGIPLHCWNSITFKRIAAAWGSLEALGENVNQALGCEKVSLLISTTQKEKIEQLLEVVVDSEVFVVRVYEVRFLGIVTGKQGIQSKDKMVKEPVADVGESSSGSLETDDRWKKSV